MIHRHLPPQGKLLDWGTGNGSLIHSKPNGYDVTGYDVNPFSPYNKDPLIGLDYWDALSMFDVVEHLFLPGVLIRRVSPKYLFLLTPIVNTAWKTDQIFSWKHFRPDEHQHYFNMKSLLLFLEKYGYNATEINHDEGALRDPEHPEYLVTVAAKRNG